MKRVEWQKLKAESKREIASNNGVSASTGLSFIYQFSGAVNHSKGISNQALIKNGTSR